MNLSEVCNNLIKKQAEKGYFCRINVYEDKEDYHWNNVQYDVVFEKDGEVKSGMYHQPDLQQAIMLAVIKLPTV